VINIYEKKHTQNSSKKNRTAKVRLIQIAGKFSLGWACL